MNLKDFIISWTAKLSGLLLLIVPIFFLLTPATVAADSKTLWFCSVLGFALLSFGYFAALQAKVFGAIVFSLFVGGGAQLWLTQPLWFPAIGLKPTDSIEMLMFGLIAMQAMLAVWTIQKTGKFSGILRLIQEFGIIRLIVFFALSAAFSVSIMGYLPRGFITSYFLHLIAGGAMVGINLLTIAALLCQPQPFTKSRGFSPLIPALVVFIASASLGWFSFERLPHVEDELVYLFQAKTIATGSFYAPAPPEAARAGLEYYLLEIRDGRWFATTPPGWASILALGVIVGFPWLVNPLMAAISVLLAHSITTRVSGPRRADILVLLMCTSPWFLATSASLMPHITAVLFTLLSWWLLLLSGKSTRKTALLAGLAGLAMGWVFVTRQLEGVIIGTLTGLLIISKWGQAGTFLRTVSYSIGAIFAGSFYFFHNAILTGQLLTAPLTRYINEQWHVGANSYGFGPQIGPPGGWGDLDIAPGHSAYEGLINTLHNISALQLELFGWGTGSLALVYVLLLWGRPDRKDALMLIFSFLIIFVMFFYWFSGSFYIGPRYWFGLLFPILYLSTSGFIALKDRLANIGVDAHSSGLTLFIICLFGLLIFTPWRGITKYYEYGSFNSDVRAAQESGAFSNAVVIFDINGNPGSALVLNDPKLPADKPIFLDKQDAASNAAAIAAFPGRKSKIYSAE